MATSFNVNYQPRPRFFYTPQFQQNQPFQPRMPMVNRFPGYIPRPRFAQPPMQSQPGGEGLDGKRMRKSLHRKTVDYNSSVIRYLENRIWQRDYRDKHVIQPDPVYIPELEPPAAYRHNVVNCVPTKFVRQSTNKMRCPIFCLAWTPEGRRLVTGASSGEFTLWNGLTFNFETILQAHDSAIRAMVWGHSDHWMITGDHSGYLKYWQSNMNNVKMFPAHPEAIRGLSFCPSDAKFASCGDDGTVRLWDFVTCQEEKVLRGHGADVKCVDWHPHKALLASGSKDSQQPIKLWDPKSGQGLATIHAHKNTVMQLKWSPNGSWLLTASRDHLIKLFDIRNMREELQTFKGHKKEASAIAWHPLYEGLFASGGAEGAIMYWIVGTDKELGCIEEAHEHVIWCLDWHPMGHILVSGSNDHSTKFWTRNRPGDKMHDKYNLNIASGEEGGDGTEESTAPLSATVSVTPTTIPGMGLTAAEEVQIEEKDSAGSIPGLSWSDDVHELKQIQVENIKSRMKVPKAKPVPKSFQDAWSSGITVEPGTTLPTGLLGNKPMSPMEPSHPPQERPRGILGDQPEAMSGHKMGPPGGTMGPPGGPRGPPGGPRGPPGGSRGPPGGPRGPSPMGTSGGLIRPPGGPMGHPGGPMRPPGPRGPANGPRISGLLETPMNRQGPPNSATARQGGLLGDKPTAHQDKMSQDQDFRQQAVPRDYEDEDLRNMDIDQENSQPRDSDFREYESMHHSADSEDYQQGNMGYPPHSNQFDRGRGRGRGMMSRGGMMPRGRGSPRGRGGFIPGPNPMDSRKRPWDGGVPPLMQGFHGGSADFDEREPMRGGFRGGRGGGMPRGARGGRGGNRGH